MADPLGVADPLEDPLGELCVPDGDEGAPGSAGSDEAELAAEDEAAAAAEDAAAIRDRVVQAAKGLTGFMDARGVSRKDREYLRDAFPAAIEFKS